MLQVGSQIIIWYCINTWYSKILVLFYRDFVISNQHLGRTVFYSSSLLSKFQMLMPIHQLEFSFQP